MVEFVESKIFVSGHQPGLDVRFTMGGDLEGLEDGLLPRGLAAVNRRFGTSSSSSRGRPSFQRVDVSGVEAGRHPPPGFAL